MTTMAAPTPTDFLARMIGRTIACDGGPLFTETKHLVAQAQAKGLSLFAVLKAANDPQHTYESRRQVGQWRHVRNDICTVVDRDKRKVITVYRNVEETDVRPDQVDEDAQRFAARRGNC